MSNYEVSKGNNKYQIRMKKNGLITNITDFN